MKKQYILLFTFLLSSIGYISAQTIVSTSPENKNAIVEESTAIHCSYCPDGHAILNQMIDQNPDDVFVIKFHEGGYATGEEMKTPSGEMLGQKEMLNKLILSFPNINF